MPLSIHGYLVVQLENEMDLALVLRIAFILTLV